MLLSIDPSIRCAGWALFDNAMLVAAGTVDQASDEPVAVRIAQFVPRLTAEIEYAERQISYVAIELPQIYPGPQTTPADDVIAAAAQVGAVLNKWSRAFLYRPREWKGQVEKVAHNERVLSRLTAEESKCMAKLPKTKRHNMIDAIGIGLHHLGRLEPKHAALGDLAAKGLTVYRRGNV